MFRHFKCIPTFRLLNLVVSNVLLTDTVGNLILCSGGGGDHLNCFRTVSEWDEPTPRNAGFLVYFTTKDNPLFC